MDASASDPASTLKFPVYAVAASALANMREMGSHEELQGTVLECWTPEMGPLVFISHQWSSFTHPDPSGQQFRALQTLVKGIPAMIEHEKRAHEASGQAPMIAFRSSVNPESFSEACTYIWLDYWCYL